MHNDEKLVGAKLYAIMVGMLICGTANTLLTKWQNGQVGVEAPAGCIPYDKDPNLACQTFTHPYVQSANMFLGEFLCLIVYGLKIWWLSRRASKGMPTPMSPG
jgi:hypothetical protein